MSSTEIRKNARAAAAMFRLPLRDAAWRGPQGGVLGRGSGGSPDFEDHRPYFPGDDVRHINWQAYARTGAYTMKVFRAEVSPAVDLIVDASASMFYDPAKAKRSLELIHFCAESALRIGAAFRCHALHAGRVTPVDTGALVAGGWTPPAPERSEVAPPLARVPVRQGSMRVLVSDLLYPVDADGLAPLAANRGRGVVFSPWCDAEATPDWDGNHEFVAVETGAVETRRVSGDTLGRYRDAYARHFTLWRDAARRHAVRLMRSGAETDLVKSLRVDALPAGAVESCL